LGRRIESLKKVTNKNLVAEKERFISNISHAEKSMAQYAESYYKNLKKRELFWKEFCSVFVVSPQKTVEYLVKNRKKVELYYRVNQAHMVFECHLRLRNRLDTISLFSTHINYLKKLGKTKDKDTFLKGFIVDLKKAIGLFRRD
jgi:hypothetical protein